MSEFTKPESELSKKKWAESESDSENSDDEDVPDVRGSSDCAAGELYEETGSEYESESEDEKLDVNLLHKISQRATKKNSSLPLSKKELKEQRQKELLDLDSLLSEFSTASVDISQNSVALENVECKALPEKSNKVKKNKKKKSTSNSERKEVAESLTHASVQDITVILKQRTKKGANTKQTGVSDAQKIALSEAAKSAGGSKKKKDKSKFNETSY